MIIENAVETSVNAVIDIIHVLGMFVTTLAFNFNSVAADGAACNNMGAQGESGSNIVTARLGNDTNVTREHLVYSRSKDSSNLFKSGAILNIGTRKTTADIQQGKLESKLLAFVEHFASAANGIIESVFVEATATDVEAKIEIQGLDDHVRQSLPRFHDHQFIPHSNDVEVQLLGKFKKFASSGERSSKLETKLAKGVGVIGQNSKDKLSIREESLDLVKFFSIIKCHLLDIVLLRVTNERLLFAWISIDDARRVDAMAEDLLDFSLASTIETNSKGSQHLDNRLIRVTLYSYCHIRIRLKNPLSSGRMSVGKDTYHKRVRFWAKEISISSAGGIFHQDLQP